MSGNFNIDMPDDLRKLPITSLQDLCEELRTFLIDHVASHGGHFSSSLGVVELTVALHYVFNTPDDKLVWDVGHQAYPHKLLTGRKSRFHSNRQLGGISGFPSREESEFDAFGTGHSSTSISAILGMACAAKYRGDHTRQHIAVIGDGAMTAGMAFEALNNAGYEQPNMLVILNDNNRSIDANTGALQDYLTELTTGKHYNALKSHIRNVLSTDAWPMEVVRKLQKAVKGGLLRYSNLFEALNIRYFGPVDGHDLKKLIHVLEKLKQIPGPKLLHCVTTKGKGFAPAMTDHAKWHAPRKFNKITGASLDTEPSGNTSFTFQTVFGNTLSDLARSNPRIIAVTPAMLSGSALTKMKQEMPARVFDVGITEQHAVTFSAGLAADGMIPFCTIYSTFLQRGYDQLIHDVALQNLDVVFCIDRAGVVGQDGPTHHGAFDIAFLRCIPNIKGAAPMDLEDFRHLLYTAQASQGTGPFAIRYPKGVGASPTIPGAYRKLEIGKGRKIRSGEDIAILSLGPVGQYAIDACVALEAYHLNIAHYDLRFFKPLDEALLHEVFQHYSTVITIEDGCITGGVGSAVMEFMAVYGYRATIKRLGLPDTFAAQGTPQQLHALYGYDSAALISLILQLATQTKCIQEILQ
ncbi:1-deoxy-D-xylulose-5-phosphate synthase [Chitinophaga dinghuensis]|uniref:1-deoxy-D-xylulose-5-phosphate synthase n=1 Tax=Chitinophaga dinghuensis TaxID=1539050 RepID=A0A327VQN5_9BACT|nr:1-deoxy-D-xylulose-5-phosphate synthase [Chitinophaga dinghuensis]RAJ77363.1 1-deoxy-D-xylulose-5-phosphate synthase [Chitinophaga dinghuensis]